MLSVAGCETIKWASLPAAGVAPAGIGTASSALCSLGSPPSSVTLTVGWLAPTV